MLWLGLSSYPREKFAELGWDSVMDRQLRVGISEFCGITDARVEFVHDSLAPAAPGRAAADAALARFLTGPADTQARPVPETTDAAHQPTRRGSNSS
ncbi:hypothetical protein [Streptomyces sp. NBC_00158]|uniref:hypothetical protein n=1 Tax=Streptomyces sp. NBC_00158 TaxID=2903627 RepID=UPI00386DC353